jgi:hypothetical protein
MLLFFFFPLPSALFENKTDDFFFMEMMGMGSHQNGEEKEKILLLLLHNIIIIVLFFEIIILLLSLRELPLSWHYGYLFQNKIISTRSIAYIAFLYKISIPRISSAKAKPHTYVPLVQSNDNPIPQNIVSRSIDLLIDQIHPQSTALRRTGLLVIRNLLKYRYADSAGFRGNHSCLDGRTMYFESGKSAAASQ